uniref:Uncharacterized protein n=1 Tax=Ditylenchus dipsaci TaxID=166011 RepID=A0A915CU40_9BILA
MSEKPQAHRPGLFKLPSKRHKTGQHRSKGAVSRDSKGYFIQGQQESQQISEEKHGKSNSKPQARADSRKGAHGRRREQSAIFDNRSIL